MIVPMSRVHVVARANDRTSLLAGLRAAGVVHLEPVDPGAAVTSADLAAHLERTAQVLAELDGVEPRGREPDMTVAEAIEECAGIRQRAAELRTRLADLHRRVDEAAAWGDVRSEMLAALHAAGLPLRLYRVPDEDVGRIRAELVHAIAPAGKGVVLVAVLGTDSAVGLPPSAEPVPTLWMDRATLRASIEEAEAELARGQDRLARIAHLVPGIVAERARLEAASRWSIAESGGVAHPDLFGVQGWVPAHLAGTLPDALAASGVAAAIELREPTDEETPPTLVRTPRWIRPIQGLFDMLGTIPGYRELDLSASFMIALPIFAGIIIGDAGYGLLFILLPLLLRKRLTAALGGDRTYLLLSFGLGALIWGALAGVWFSVPATVMVESGGAIGTLGRVLGSLQVIRGTDDQVWTLLMKICFVAGTVHLVLAHLRRATLATAATPLADVGWAIVLVATLGVIWMLFFGGAEPLSPLLRNATLASLAGGMALVITFASPHRSTWRRIGRGFAGSLLPLVGAFSDTLSYIRLMAVGLGGFYLGSACNLIAADVAASAGWFFGALVLVLGHTMNLALIVIAIFAHGVRLNLLEFSSHIGMRWNGHPYRPFA